MVHVPYYKTGKSPKPTLSVMSCGTSIQYYGIILCSGK